MKKTILVLLVVMVGMAGQAQFKSANLQAAGLTCAMCTKAINKALEQVPFIQDVKVDIKTSSFQVNFKEGIPVDFDVIRKAVEDAGFSVAKLKVVGIFDKVTVENDAHVQIDGKTFHFLNINKQTLQGERSITLVDKDFVSTKEYKKYSAATSMACIKTGRAQNCCTKEGIAADSRIYHVTI
ncbi:heavy metal-associated domain-containing protein [Paraflavitalea speifideaquila]|uniref:heavy-metal-associated domain-containing protein n=1 Tax=Paraflavitalea speifideaquila TaxID=3076558 RepID=UPI0028E59F86|nr:heavy metal-associated domain-containing protein [Paraflavitalea speifideiaquila]